MVEPLRPKTRRVVFALLVTVCLVVAVGYGARAVQRTRSETGHSAVAGVPAAETSGDSAAARALIGRSPTVLFRNEVTGENWAKTALVPVTAPAGSRSRSSRDVTPAGRASRRG